METALLAVVLVLLGGLTFLNGFHDASNAVATAVRTRALTPRVALLVIAAFTALGTFLSSQLGVVLVDRFDTTVPQGTEGLALLLVSIVSAGVWGLYTWWKGQPSSSTHAILAAVAGAGLADAALGRLSPGAAGGLLLGSVLLPLALTTVIAAGAAYLLSVPVLWAVRHWTTRSANEGGRMAQAIGACAVALAHGLQDGQRAMALGIVSLGCLQITPDGGARAGMQVAVALLLGLGVLGGGWRITYTLSSRLVSLDPLRAGVANAVSAGLLLMGAIGLRLPISSTQAVTAALVGAGMNQRYGAVNWSTARVVAGYWLLTPVVCGVLSAVLFLAASPLL